MYNTLKLLFSYYYLDLPVMKSTIKTIAATTSNMCIKFPPILNSRPNNQKATTSPPNHLKTPINATS